MPHFLIHKLLPSVIEKMSSTSTPNHIIEYGLEFTPGVARYSNEINFDEASCEWNRNKKRIGQMYLYICGEPTASGRPCQRRPKKSGCYCAQHT